MLVDTRITYATAPPGGLDQGARHRPPAPDAGPASIDAHEPWMRGLHADTGYLLYRLGLRSGQLFNAFLQESGLRLRHYALLRFLATVRGRAPARAERDRSATTRARSSAWSTTWRSWASPSGAPPPTTAAAGSSS